MKQKDTTYSNQEILDSEEEFIGCGDCCDFSPHYSNEDIEKFNVTCVDGITCIYADMEEFVELFIDKPSNK